MTKYSHHPRVRVLVENDNGEILLIRSVFGMKAWELPGGAVKSHESRWAAAVRELYEETGVSVHPHHLQKRATIATPFSMEIFYLRFQGKARIVRPFEIKELGWFTRMNLPAGTANYVIDIVKGPTQP